MHPLRAPWACDSNSSSRTFSDLSFIFEADDASINHFEFFDTWMVTLDLTRRLHRRVLMPIHEHVLQKSQVCRGLSTFNHTSFCYCCINCSSFWTSLRATFKTDESRLAYLTQVIRWSFSCP